ncbi:hypothetical protein EIP86_006104 [Pleurotus ostreatoroseus]|nr:hypothetical protein EIP86_006104 [Pleurotus ostreatoroseus]
MSPKLILSNVLAALLARAYGSRWTIGNEPSVPGAPKHLHHLEVLQNAWSFNTSHLEISDVAAVRSHDRMAGCSDAGLFDILTPENQVKTIKPFSKRSDFLSARIFVKKARSVPEGPMARGLLAALVLGLYNGSEKQWSEAALDILWLVIYDFRPLLNLLAPMVLERRTTPQGIRSFINFRRPLRADDWNNWDRYARRVRTIRLDDRRASIGRKQLSANVYEEISRTCPREDLLPNLQHVYWWATIAERQARSITFMHSNIRTLSLYFRNNSIHSLPTYVDNIALRVPHLTKLEVRADVAMHELQTDILSLVSRIPELRWLVVPMYFLTSLMMTELARLPCLETIELAQPTSGGTGNPIDVSDFHPNLILGAFPSLKKLGFAANLQHAVDFAALPFGPRDLVSINLRVLAVETSQLLRQYFSRVSVLCKQLTELHIDFVLGPGAHVGPMPSPVLTRPAFDTFEPLLSCRNIKVLELRWDYQLDLHEDDMEALASSWPSIEVLLLNCDPIPEIHPPALTPLALIPFAKHCSRLRELSLYIDATQMLPSLPNATRPFQSLAKLAFGSSPIREVDSMVLFLSCLCPVNCKLISGVRWPEAYGVALDKAGVCEDIRTAMADWWIKWTNVGNMLHLAIKVRTAEKMVMSQVMNEYDRYYRRHVEELEEEVRLMRSKLELSER